MLRVLMQPDRRMKDRTLDAISGAAADEGLEDAQVRRALQALEERESPLVASDVDATPNQRLWIANNAAGEAMEDEYQFGGS